MRSVVSYDVRTLTKAGRKRLRQMAKKCEDWGIRVQNSVFECNVDLEQWVGLRAQLEDIGDPETDSLRFYNLGQNYTTRIEHFGAKPSIDALKDTLVV